MKANKALKRLAKIEALMSEVTERYSSAPHIREVLQDAEAAVIRAKAAVSLEASSRTATSRPVQHSKPPSKATPEPAKPRGKLRAGRKAIIAPTKKAPVKAPPAKAAKKSAPVKKAAKKTAPAPAQAATQAAGQ